MARSAETLSSYRVRLLRELKDANQQYFNNQNSATPNLDLNAWINQAIRWRDLWSGGSRAYKAAVPTTVGIDQYDLNVLFPQDTVLDVINLWLLWGANRIPLSEEPLGVITNLWRQQVGRTAVPGAYCRYGATSIFIATAPGSTYTADWDVSVLSVQFVNDADADPLPYPYTEPVVTYAAHLAKRYQRQWDEAESFYQDAVRALKDIEGSRVGSLPQ